MTLALYRIMDCHCRTLLTYDGFEELVRVYHAKTAGLSPSDADERADELIADPDAAAALAGVRIVEIVEGVYDFLRELLADEAAEEMRREFLHAAAFRIDNRLPPPKPPAEGDSANGMSWQEADRKARNLARENARFYTLSGREQARWIGCSWATWRRAPFFTQARWTGPKAGRPQQRKGAAPPKVVSLTNELESVIGEGRREEVLEKLIAGQDTDFEPSPLDPDPPDARPKRVHSRKRL